MVSTRKAELNLSLGSPWVSAEHYHTKGSPLASVCCLTNVLDDPDQGLHISLERRSVAHIRSSPELEQPSRVSL